MMGQVGIDNYGISINCHFIQKKIEYELFKNE